MATKPSSHLDWGVGNPDPSNNIVEPSPAKKITGWTADERPAYEFFNWLFFRQDEWNKYFEEEIGSAVASWDAIVGTQLTFPEATHDTLEDVMADGTVTNGSRILVLESRTIENTIIINKQDIEIYFKPAVTYTKGSGDTTCFSVSASGVKFINGRFANWTAGGDKVFDMTGLAAYCVFQWCRFALNTDTAIDESNVNAGQKPIVNTIQESA